MLASLERRVARLEAQRPKPAPTVGFLAPRAPFTWLPRGMTRLTPKQSEIFLHRARFRVAVAGRRGGKSGLSVAELIRAARRGFYRLCWGIYPSYRMARQIVWGALKAAIPPRWIAYKNEADLTITLRGYNSTIALRSADNPDALRGVGLDFAVLDEYSSIDPSVWPEVIRPALADKRGEGLILGTPRGFNHLYALYTYAQEAEDWAAFKYTTAEGGLVLAEEIAAVKISLDPRTFGQEFLADFATSTDRVYLMFQREHNVREDLKDLGGPLLTGQDFNISPMASIMGQKVGDEFHVLNELSAFNSNTQEVAEELKRQYPGRPLTIFPDPTGKARKTSAPVGQTDLSILEKAGFRVVVPHQPYAVVDRINTVNALLCNAQGRRRLFIHPRCKRLIEGLEQLSYKEGTSIIDKSKGLDHHIDALGYVCMAEFPLIEHRIGQARIAGVY